MDLYHRSVALRLEIGDAKKNIRTGDNHTEVNFKNGSKIVVVTSSDNARGARSNILVVDEYRLVEYDIVTSVLQPMGAVPRQPEFKNRYPKKYKDYQETNYEIYLSSAWYKSNWSWNHFESYFKSMIDDGDSFAISIPYQVPILHNLLDKSTIIANQTSDLFNPVEFQMEYEGLFYGGNDKGFFELKDLNDIRTVSKTFIPPTDVEYLENASLSKPKNLSNIPKIPGEIRIISLDVALAGNSHGRRNDTSAIIGIRLIPEKDYYIRQVVYIESVQGAVDTTALAIKFKRLFYDFESDYGVLDVNGMGIGVYDACAGILRDDDRDIEYPAWVSMNDDTLKEKSKYVNALPVLWTIKASAKLNNDIAFGLKIAIKNGRLRLPISDIQKREDFVSEKKLNFIGLPYEEQLRYLSTYTQASLMINELVDLEYDVSGANIKIKEVGSATKDRYSALAYVNYVAGEIEKEAIEESDSGGFDDYIHAINWGG